MSGIWCICMYIVDQSTDGKHLINAERLVEMYYGSETALPQKFEPMPLG